MQYLADAAQWQVGHPAARACCCAHSSNQEPSVFNILPFVDMINTDPFTSDEILELI